MKDERGLYYFPFPQNRRVKMYVRRVAEDIEFRLWNADEPALWDEHGWVPHGAVLAASKMYTGREFDPKTAYDRHLAEALLADDA